MSRARFTAPLRRAALAVSLLCACGGARAVDLTGEGYYEDALQRYERQDYAGAILQLKNALQKDPNQLAAHILLGKALLNAGDPAGAELNFTKALTLGADRAEIVVPLAQAYAAQGKARTLLDRLGPDGLPRNVRIELMILRGNAQIELGDTAAAERTYADARALDDRSVAVRLAQGNLLLRIGATDRAIAALDEIFRIAPNDSRAWTLRGSIAHLQGDAAGALDAYAKAAQLDPANVDAQVARAGVLIDLGRLDEADKIITAVQQRDPRDRPDAHEPRAAYLRALWASRKGDTALVRASLGDVVAVLDRVPKAYASRNAQLLVLGGLAHYGLGNPEKAAEYLELLLKINPRESGAAKLLASIYLERGDSGRALALLEPLYRAGSNDAQLLALMAAAQMRAGRASAASRTLEDAVRLADGVPQLRADFGLSLIQIGQDELGARQLQEAFAKSGGQTQPGIVLAALYLKRMQPARAVEVLETVVRREPRNAIAQNLLGVARLGAGDVAGARKAYIASLAADGRFSPATLNLARLDASQGQAVAARDRLQALLRADAANGDAMFELARLEEQAGRPVEAARWLERAMASPHERVRAGVLLTDLLLRQQDAARALAVAKDLAAKSPRDPSALLARARAELASGNRADALQTLATAGPLLGFDPDRNVALARLHLAADDRAGARYAIDKALQGSPGHFGALVLRGEMAIADKDFGRAEDLVKSLAQRAPNDATPARLQGDLASARGQYAAAASAYRTAYARDPSVEAAMRVYGAHLQNGERAKGIAFLEQFARERPSDVGTVRALADVHFAAGNLAAARAGYEKLLAQRPNEADVLNNLAQVASRQRDSAARKYAEQAHAAAPQDPAILDTLGWLLVADKEYARALGLLRDARLRDAANPEIRYHLAVALARTGRESEARTELRDLVAAGTAFEGIEDARKLLAQLGP